MGNATEQGLIKFLWKSNSVEAPNMLRVKAEKYGNNEPRIIANIPFSSKLKKEVTAVVLPDAALDNNTVRVFVKGAPDFCYEQIETYIGENGKIKPFDKNMLAYAKETVVRDNFAKNAFRTILLAYKDFTLNEFIDFKKKCNDFKTDEDKENLKKLKLTMICIFALQDPLRPEIKDAVQKCYQAGITIRMVTGDNLDTAKAIAIEAGILTAAEAVDTSRPYAFMDSVKFSSLFELVKTETKDSNDKV